MRLTVFILYGIRFSFNHEMYFIFPKSICILLKVNLYAFSLCVLVVQKCLESNRHFTLRTHSNVLDRLIGPSKLQMFELCFTLYVYVLWTIYMKHISAECCIRTVQTSSVVRYSVQSGHNRLVFFSFFTRCIFILVVTLLYFT